MTGNSENRTNDVVWDNAKDFCEWKVFWASELVAEGAEEVSTQWIEVDKNEHMRTDVKVYVETNLRSRLVAMGNQEKQKVRSDSPTADTIAIHLVCSFSASHRLKIKCGDLENAYFNGMKMTRVLLLRQPKGGLPGMNHTDRLLAKVPIYGTQDAGRGFWRKLLWVLKKAGWKPSSMYGACYYFTVETEIRGVLATHVDDLIWAVFEGLESVMKEVAEYLTFGKMEEMNFRFCGREVTQSEEFTIKITCRDTTLKLNPIVIKTTSGKASPDERAQYESVAGSLAWICRVSRADIMANVSKIQQRKKHLDVPAMQDANKVVKYAKEHADRGFTFKSGVLDWSNMVCTLVSDASWAEEVDVITGEPHRSLGAMALCLTTPSFPTDGSGFLHVVYMSASIIHRVCRATIQAETYQLELGVEHLDVLRAAIVDMRTQLDYKDWERTSSKNMKSVWFTDCQSTEAALERPVLGEITDKRLSIEIAILRQSVWRRAGDKVGDSAILDDLPCIDEATDICRWCDTDVMFVDALTKVMSPEKLMEVLELNFWSVAQPIESLRKKRVKQAQRKAKKVKDHDELEGDVEEAPEQQVMGK